MRLPPLTALVHFTEAASSGSFKAAAKSLNITESAVSRQVRLLEEYLTQPLFERAGRGVVLTEAGHRLLASSGPAFQQISQVTEELLGRPQQLNLSATTSFSIRWLMPRIADFEAQQDGVPVTLQAGRSPLEAAGGRSDASIIYLLGNPYEKEADVPPDCSLFMVEWLLPVCAPGYLADSGPIDPSELADHRLMFNEPTGRDWRLWLRRVPGAQADFSTAMRFEHDDTAIHAAVAGHGIALGNIAYMANEIAMGSLVPAVDHAPVAAGGHYLHLSPDRARLAQVRAFARWLRATAADDPSQRDNPPLPD